MNGRLTCIMAITVLILTGCWSRTEINDMSIVIGVAIDKADEDHIRLSLQIANPKTLGPAGSGQGSSGQDSSILLSAKGETIMGAYRIIQEKLPREIFFAHSRVIIIGEELAKDGVGPVLDFFSRSRQAHLRSYILVTKGKAIEVLKLKPRLEPILSEEIREQEKTKVGLDIQIRDFLKNLLTEGEEPVAATISIKKLTESEVGSKSEKTPTIDGAAVFRGQKLIGWMNNKESRGILWLRNEMKTGVMSIMIPVDKGGGEIAAYLLKGKTDIKPVFQKGKLLIKIKATADISISENTSELDLSDHKNLKSVEPIFEKDISERIQLTMDIAQKELKSDIFGIGQIVYRTYPNKWERMYKQKWRDIFPELEVEITSNVKVNGTGYSTKSMSQPDSDY